MVYHIYDLLVFCLYNLRSPNTFDPFPSLICRFLAPLNPTSQLSSSAPLHFSQVSHFFFFFSLLFVPSDIALYVSFLGTFVPFSSASIKLDSYVDLHALPNLNKFLLFPFVCSLQTSSLPLIILCTHICFSMLLSRFSFLVSYTSRSINCKFAPNYVLIPE